MAVRKGYTVEEDVCLAEALLAHKLIFKGHGLKKLSTNLSGVYRLFKRKTAAFGINGDRRTSRSIEARTYFLKEAVKHGRLCRYKDPDNPLAKRRVILWSEVFGIRCPAAQIKPVATTQQRHKPVTNEGKPLSPANRKPVVREESLHESIQKQKHLSAKKLLQTLHSIQKRRNEIKLKREENIRRQQENEYLERKWKIEMFQRILEKQDIVLNDEVQCAHLLKILEDIAESDAQLCLMREGNVQDKTEYDREYFEWERSAFEELIKKYH